MTIVDLRSDTLTKPTAAMREAMASAEVGDDVWREDPTSRRLEERVAELLGKEAALFVPSGTMANQIALMLHCRPGDEVICGRGSHVRLYESGAGAALAGVQFAETGESDGTFDADAIDAAMQPPDYHAPRTRLVELENTHNRGGGRVWPRDRLRAVCER
ncbi:MAG: aminotransferase class I/II-fold pyridoxal phosphate-dependent enzyme, partial [Myxococcota bacterium]|nr:aminotransferase class I/II-fold pyridoxal phosphate-dependent enzyme [Myxococcota bacterium]